MTTPISLDSPVKKESQVIHLGDRRNELRMNKKGFIFSGKLGAVVGPTYVFCKTLSDLAYLLGGVYGLLTSKKPIIRLHTLRLKINYFINSAGRSGYRIANTNAALIFLYLIVAKTSNYIFQEELHDLGEYQKAALFGGFTGFICRIAFPYQAIFLSSILGAGTACTYHYLWNKYFKYDKLTE